MGLQISKIVILFILIVSLNSCALIRAIFGGESNPNKPRDNITIGSTPKEVLSPSERNNLALSDYNTARAFEIKYYDTRNRRDAEIAVQHFESYYRLSPNGEYAVLSLLRKVELLIEIGSSKEARREFDRLMKRKNIIKSYEEEIDYIRKKLY